MSLTIKIIIPYGSENDGPERIESTDKEEVCKEIEKIVERKSKRTKFSIQQKSEPSQMKLTITIYDPPRVFDHAYVYPVPMIIEATNKEEIYKEIEAEIWRAFNWRKDEWDRRNRRIAEWFRETGIMS